MTAKRLALFLAAILVALATALLVSPARWLMHAMPAQAPLVLVDAAGSLWAGQGVVAIGPPGMQRTLPDPVRWQWQWRWGARPTVTINHRWLQGPLTLTPGLTATQLGAQRLHLPAQVLAVAGAPFNSLEPDGQLVVSWPAQTLGAAHVGPVMHLQWADAASARVQVRPLGHYTATFARRADRGLDLQVATQSGALRVQGSGAWTPGAAWTFTGSAQAAPHTDAATRDALVPLLSMLGRRNGDISTLQY